MKVCWVLGPGAAQHQDQAESMRVVAPIWGSHVTWRTFNTDNVICNNLGQARELLQRAFQAVCNFYTHKDNYLGLGRPNGVKLYEGQFDPTITEGDELIACHLVAGKHDIVLLIGFDLSEPKSSDKLEQHRALAWLRAMTKVIQESPNTQWVLVDSSMEPTKKLRKLPNFTCDKMSNVIQLLV